MSMNSTQREEAKFAAFCRLVDSGEFPKFLDRQKNYLIQFPQLSKDEIFFRVLKEFPPPGEERQDAFTTEEIMELKKWKVKNKPKAKTKPNPDDENVLFPSNFDELPQGTHKEAMEFVLANLYNSSLQADEFPSKLAYTQWRLARDNPKAVQQLATKQLQSEADSGSDEVEHDTKAQYTILKRLYAWYGMDWDDVSSDEDVTGTRPVVGVSVGDFEESDNIATETIDTDSA